MQMQQSRVTENRKSQADPSLMAMLSDPRLPSFRISTRMENGNHLNLILFNIIKDSERKAPHHRASEISVYDRIQVRITNDLCQSLVDTVHELMVQVFALLAIHCRASASSASASEENRMIM